MITLKLTVSGSVPLVHYMQIQVGFHEDAITHRKALKKVSFTPFLEYRFQKLSFSRSSYPRLFDSIKINIVFGIICFILCSSELA